MKIYAHLLIVLVCTGICIGFPVIGAAQNNTDEAIEALTDLRSFKNLPKFPGILPTDKQKFRENFLPEIKNLKLLRDTESNQRAAKLGARVFAVHSISDQCETVVIENNAPSVLTWKLTFVVLTTATLGLLTDDEIIALLAHEAGHLYYVDELRRARTGNDSHLARVAELKADIVALETLDELHIPYSNLTSALGKLVAARNHLGLKSATEQSPSLETRARLVKEYEKRRASGTLFKCPALPRTVLKFD